jgi:hypothetical protein
MWRGLVSTQRQAQKLISGPSPAAKTRLLSFSGSHSRAVTGLLTGQNTLGRCLYLTGLIDSPLCRRYSAEEGSSAHVLCECEALASLRHAYLGSCFSDPEEIGSLSLVTMWNFSKGTGLTWLDIRLWSTKGLSKGLGALGPKVLEPKRKYKSKSNHIMYMTETMSYADIQNIKILYHCILVCIRLCDTEQNTHHFPFYHMMYKIS